MTEKKLIMIDLSIIIVCYRGWERLIKCLEPLNSFAQKEFTTEVIVVDNDSGDEESLKKIENQFPRFTFIRNTVNGGFGYGCNTGAKIASGRFLIFLNPDTVASEPEAGRLLKTALENPSFTILSCRQVNEKGKESKAASDFPEWYNLTGIERSIFKSGERTGESASITFPDWVSGSVIMMLKEEFQRTGGFDEDYWMYYEDVDLCKRVRNAGGEIAFCRNITIEHNHGGSSRINLKTASVTKTEVHISRHVYISKHKHGAERSLIQAFLVLNNLISGFLSALAGLLLFFIPKAFLRTLIFFRLIKYYAGALAGSSWISPRSVNFINYIYPFKSQNK